VGVLLRALLPIGLGQGLVYKDFKKAVEKPLAIEEQQKIGGTEAKAALDEPSLKQ
jgi:hypothetical protein